MKIRERLDAVTGGAAATPLLVLFGLNFVDELDQILFGIATPEIRNTFGLSDSGIIVIAAMVTVFVLFAVLPVTYLADRFNRVRLVFFAALGWMSMSVLTGLSGWAGVVVLLVIARMGSGLGRTMNDPVHASLLTDYYRPDVLPRIFEFHRAANPVSRVTAVVIGAGAGFLGWQAMFVVLAIPTLFLLAATIKLPVPVRGGTSRAVAELVSDELGVDELPTGGEQETPAAPVDGEEQEEDKVSFTEARRTLFAIPSMRRLYMGAFLLGTGFLTIGTISSLFFEDIYGFSPFLRGVQAFLAGAGTLAGLRYGQRLASRAVANGRLPDLAKITGLSFTAGAVGLVLMAVTPFAFGSLVFSVLAATGIAAFQPAYYPLVAMVTPARIRTQAYGWSLILVGAGGLIGSIIIGGLAEESYRSATVGLAIMVGLAGAVGASSFRFVTRDIAQAQANLDTAAAVDAEGALLLCRGVEVAYDQVQVLFGVDMVVQEGECVALLGTNGAGKSTLLKAISGVVDPIGGAIYFDGKDITHIDAANTTAEGVIQVPGGKAVFPTLTVAEHLRAAGWLYRDDPEHIETTTREVLDTFPRLEERIDQLAGNLSGGEQQMLALGMAFIAKPRILVIDELSLGLAPTIVEQLLGIVRRIQESGTAIILVEQSINVALTVADRAYFMEKGEVRFEGPTTELLGRDDIVRSVFLEGAGSANGGGAGATDDDPDSTSSSSVEVHERAPVDTTRDPVLVLNGVTKRFGGITAVDDASFHLHEGEILGLIGPNGAGKTTIFDIVSGFLDADSGRIRFQGADVTKLGPDKRAWMGLGRSFQDARLVGSLTVAENIAIGLERHLEIHDHLASLLNLPLVVRQEEDVSWTVDDLIELMNLGDFRDKFVRELSTGSRRIVDLAMCVAHDPTVLLLDEPSSGIAQKETEALGPLLTRIQAETGCALLVIEHDMPLITSISDRMIALELGHPIVEGTPREVVTDKQVVSSYLGGDMASINRSGDAAPSGPPAADPAAPKPETRQTRKSATKRAAPVKAQRKTPLRAER